MPTSGYLDTPWGPMKWTAPDDPPRPLPVSRPPPKELTVEEQAYEDVKAYFAEQGKPVPPEDIIWCQEAIRLEAEALARPPPIFDAPMPKPIDERPEYGTPEFWAWCRRTKKDREAKKAAEEAAKEAKRKEKEDAKNAAAAAKLAEKQAKEAAKAAKEAEKAAKAAAKAAKKTSGKGTQSS